MRLEEWCYIFPFIGVDQIKEVLTTDQHAQITDYLRIYLCIYSYIYFCLNTLFTLTIKLGKSLKLYGGPEVVIAAILLLVVALISADLAAQRELWAPPEFKYHSVWVRAERKYANSKDYFCEAIQYKNS